MCHFVPLRQGLSLSLQYCVPTELANQLAPASHGSPPPSTPDYRNTHLTLVCVLGIWIQVVTLVSTVSTLNYWAISPAWGLHFRGKFLQRLKWKYNWLSNYKPLIGKDNGKIVAVRKKNKTTKSEPLKFHFLKYHFIIFAQIKFCCRLKELKLGNKTTLKRKWNPKTERRKLFTHLR